MIEHQNENFSFSYQSKTNKKENNIKKIFKYLNFIYYSILSVCLGFIVHSAINATPSNDGDMYYDKQDIINFSYKINSDIEKQINNESLGKLDHVSYENKAFEKIKELAAKFKKENKDIQFLTKGVIVTENSGSSKYMQMNYSVLMPYIETTNINNKTEHNAKYLSYNIYQNKYSLIVSDISKNSYEKKIVESHVPQIPERDAK